MTECSFNALAFLFHMYSRLHGTIPTSGSKEVALNILRISTGLTSRSLFVSVKGRQPCNIDLDCLQIPIASFPNCFMTIGLLDKKHSSKLLA